MNEAKWQERIDVFTRETAVWKRLTNLSNVGLLVIWSAALTAFFMPHDCTIGWVMIHVLWGIGLVLGGIYTVGGRRSLRRQDVALKAQRQLLWPSASESCSGSGPSRPG